MGLQLIASQIETDGAGRIRERELEAGGLVLRAIRSAAAGSSFVLRRAASAVDAMERSPARSALGRAVAALSDDAIEATARTAELRQALVCYGGVLERHCLWPAAREAYAAALSVVPLDPELMLHLARTHRLSGERAAALELYRTVREVSGGAGLARFAELGEALLAGDAAGALTRVLGAARAAGDAEVCAVALEERARLHRNAARIDEAVADYLAAAAAYDTGQDRVRIAHAVADLMLARGDVQAAREALYIAQDIALPAQRPHVVHRLRAVARVQNDEVGLRRWPASKPSALVSLIGPRRGPSVQPTLAPLLQAWRDRPTGVATSA